MMERMIGPTVEIRFRGEPDLRLIRADQGQVEQILMNLAVNARDAMPSGGTIGIETRNVDLDEEFCRQNMGRKPGPHIKLTFSDSGEGMSPEIQEKLFEPFFTTKNSGSGTGLGLATVYGIVKQHDGIINVSSGMGQGSVFSIYLPAAEGEESPLETPLAGEPVGGNETILLVEDEPLLRNLGQRVLGSAGYEVLVAADGQEALKVFKAHSSVINALVLDVVMPRLSGTEVADQIRQNNPEIPIVFVSGYDFEVAGDRSEVLEGTVRLSKPYSSHDLLEAVRQVISSHGKARGKE
jgi:CheY-like chemotaxis protein